MPQAPATMPDSGNLIKVSLFGKLLVVLLPCLLGATALGAWWLTDVEVDMQRDRFATRIGNMSARVAGGLERYGWSVEGADHWQNPLPQALLSTLLGDQAVRCVELFVGDADAPRLSAPQGVGCLGLTPEATLEMAVGEAANDRLIVHFDLDEIRASDVMRSNYVPVLMSAGLLVALISCWMAFRVVVGNPLRALLRAIRRSDETGEPRLVDDIPRDELGTVIEAYNAMQQRLGDEAVRVHLALERLDRIYNTTPALLCSIRLDGEITSVSDHWLSTMGLQRDQVLRRSLCDFVGDNARATLSEQVIDALSAEGQASNVPIELITSDGRKLNVLMSAVREQAVDGEPLALCVMTDISLLKDTERRLQKMALSDALTNLPNRRGLVDHLDRAIARENLTDRRSIMAVLFIDLDGFKWINDTYGHQAGDNLLTATAERLQHCVRANDMIARLGGDEFAIVCHRLETRCMAERIAERIIEMVAQPFQLGAVEGHVGASIGIAYLAPEMSGSDDLLRLADLAMYAAKQAGKGCYRTYSDDLSQKAATANALQESIRGGLRHGWFSLALQPIVRLADGVPVGAEALLRLHCPDQGNIPPDVFIPVAEETGLIREVGSWVVDQAIHQLARLSNTGADDDQLFLSINLSPQQLTHEFAASLQEIFEERPELRRRLVIEVTERALMSRDDSALSQLVATRDAGALIALDDFGTGYSSLGQLQKLPIDILKIDRSLVIGLVDRDADHTRQQMATIRATAGLAEELGIAVVAEGIEDRETVKILQDAGIGLGQGYLFCPPMAASEFHAWLERTVKPPARATKTSAHATVC